MTNKHISEMKAIDFLQILGVSIVSMGALVIGLWVWSNPPYPIYYGFLEFLIFETVPFTFIGLLYATHLKERRYFERIGIYPDAKKE